MELGSPAVTLDLSVVRQLREIAQNSDPNLFNTLVDLYHNDCSRYVATIHESIEHSDLVTAKRAAHALKSASSNMGAVRVAEHCRLLEQHSDSNNHAIIIELVQTIDIEYVNACAALKQLCEVAA